jgi:hypothetical protein
MDEPTDPLARQLALSALTTEQFNLQTARMGTIAEANGRSTLHLGTLSSAVIAIAFVGQANELGDAFYLFALLLPPVFLLGTFSYLRLVQTSIEDMVYAVGTFRIRQYFLGLDPRATPFFPPTDPWGMTRLERIGVVATGRLQLLLTAASMVGCVNAIVWRGGRRPGGPRPGGRPGSGGGGHRRAGGGGSGRALLRLPGPALPRGTEPGSAGMGPARRDRRHVIPAHRPRRSSSSRTRAKRRAARAAVGSKDAPA